MLANTDRHNKELGFLCCGNQRAKGDLPNYARSCCNAALAAPNPKERDLLAFLGKEADADTTLNDKEHAGTGAIAAADKLAGIEGAQDGLLQNERPLVRRQMRPKRELLYNVLHHGHLRLLLPWSNLSGIIGSSKSQLSQE